MRYLKQYNFKNYKWLLAITVILIASCSVPIVGSAKESVQDRQLMGVIIGTIAMLCISLVDFKWIMKFQWILYIIGVISLILVEFFGYEANGAVRWIDLKFTTLQPSEFVKIILVIFFAIYFADRKERISTFRVVISAGLLFAIPVFLILRQPDLSTTLCVSAVFLTLLFMSGLTYKIVAPVVLTVVPLSILLLLYVIQPDQVLLQDYQQNRVLAWLYPEDYANTEAYQQINSMIAIGSGQLTGKGLNNNTTTSVKNGNYISEPQTDFIFSIIGEELGFRGCCAVIICLFFIIMQCIMIGIRAQNFAGKLICYGMASLIAYQSFINMGVATAILPNTGIPLPFVSYGLSSLVSMFAGIGIVLNIGLQQKKYQ